MFNLTVIRQTSAIYLNNYVNILKTKRQHIRNQSTKVALKTEPITELIKDVEKVSKITTKAIKKKPQKPPFVKNLFLGTFDTDILTYPEVLDKETVDKLQSDVKPIEEFFQGVHAYKGRTISRQYLENLSKLKLLGLQAPSVIGCRQLSLTEACRLNEIIAQNTGCTGIILNEVLGIQTLLRKGSETQLNKYLNELVDGKTVMAYCISEPASSKPRTRATVSSDGKTWILNGEKAWVVNGSTADLFIVMAETDLPNKLNVKQPGTTAFLIERSFGGVTTKACEPIGLEQTDISNVTFENTPVPTENIIGDINNGENVFVSVLPELRLSTGPLTISLLKKLIGNFSKHCIESDNLTATVSTTEAVQSKLGMMTTLLYAIESMTYLTSSLIDQYENQDCELETAIVKAFGAEHGYNSVLSCMDFIGTTAYMSDHWCNKLCRDALGHLLLNESTDNTKLVIALLGIQYAGIHLNDRIKMIRNPLFHPAAMFQRMWTHRKQIEDNPKLKLKLYEYVHPSLVESCQLLEYAVLRLQFATETLLARYGPEVVSKHVDLKRLADCVIDIYAMTAVIGRASRSYCIGLQHADLEIQIANAFCFSAKDRVKENIRKITGGPYITADEFHFKLARQVFKTGGYFSIHPLTRNF